MLLNERKNFYIFSKKAVKNLFFQFFRITIFSFEGKFAAFLEYSKIRLKKNGIFEKRFEAIFRFESGL